MKTNCEQCSHSVYDEENGSYTCTVPLDEDEMFHFLQGNFQQCPYYQNSDAYSIVRKQN